MTEDEQAALVSGLISSGCMLDVVYPSGRHDYWSTHCRHERHGACEATELAPGVPRRPAQCKTCASPCICPCHVEAVYEEPMRAARREVVSAFARLARMGALDAEFEHAQPLLLERFIHAANREQADLILMKHGYTLAPPSDDQPEDPDWYWLSASKSEAP